MEKNIKDTINWTLDWSSDLNFITLLEILKKDDPNGDFPKELKLYKKMSPTTGEELDHFQKELIKRSFCGKVENQIWKFSQNRDKALAKIQKSEAEWIKKICTELCLDDKDTELYLEDHRRQLEDKDFSSEDLDFIWVGIGETHAMRCGNGMMGE